jgi:acyl-CoA dehydrogenase
MDFEHSPKVAALQKKLTSFMDRHIYPNETRYEEELTAGGRWQPPPLLEELKKKARAEELWYLFLPHSKHGAGLTNLECAPLCEIMGRVHWASEVFNCSAPDTGNMEVLRRGPSPTRGSRSSHGATTRRFSSACGCARRTATRGASCTEASSLRSPTTPWGTPV